jgi:Fe-S-cluster containining protein
MIPAHFLQRYEAMTSQADSAFRNMKREHASAVKCEQHCADCCHAVFGLFFVEAAYLKHFFDRVDRGEKEAVMKRAEQAHQAHQNLEKKLFASRHDPEKQTYILAMERIRCPLLNEEQDCVLYSRRPITCRVYGIPTRIHGRTRICGKTELAEGDSKIEVFDLDRVYRDLYGLSKELLRHLGVKNTEKAGLLASVSKALSTETDDLMGEIYA